MDAALVDTSFIIDGLHGTRAQREQYKRTIKAIQFPCASSYTKFEYTRKLGQQIQLAYNRLAQGASLREAVIHLNSITSRSWGRGPAIAINVLLHTQEALREPDPDIEARKALVSLKLQSEQLSNSFGKLSGLDLRDGTRCHYQGTLLPTFLGAGSGRRMRWTKIECLPENLRCRVHHHLRREPNKKHCNEVIRRLRVLDSPTAEQKNMLEAVKMSRSRAGPLVLASHRICQGIADLIIFMDALQLKNAITTNYKEWRAFDGVGGVRVIQFTGNPADAEPPPFAGAD